MTKNNKTTFLIIGCSNGLGLQHIFRNVFKKNKKQFYCVSKNHDDEIWEDDSHTYINLSSGGAGNRYITGRLLEWIHKYGAPDYVYVQYTGLHRLDVNISKNTVIPDYQFQQGTEYSNWIFSGGLNASWLSNKQTQKLFINLYDPNDQTNIITQNLFEIKNAINFLEAEKIKYNWSTYYDYENPPNKETAIDGILNSSTKQIYKDLNNTNRITKSLVNHIVETDSDFLEKDCIHWKFQGGMNWLSSMKEEFIIKDMYGR